MDKDERNYRVNTILITVGSIFVTVAIVVWIYYNLSN